MNSLPNSQWYTKSKISNDTADRQDANLTPEIVTPCIRNLKILLKSPQLLKSNVDWVFHFWFFGGMFDLAGGPRKRTMNTENLQFRNLGSCNCVNNTSWPWTTSGPHLTNFLSLWILFLKIEKQSILNLTCSHWYLVRLPWQSFQLWKEDQRSNHVSRIFIFYVELNSFCKTQQADYFGHIISVVSQMNM